MIRVVRNWHEQHKSLGPFCSASTVQAFSAAYLSSAADHDHPFMTTVDYLLTATSRRVMPNVTQLRSPQPAVWNVATGSVLQWPPVTTFQNTEQLWDVVDREIHIIEV